MINASAGLKAFCLSIHQVQNLSAEDAGKKGDDHGKHHGDTDAVVYVSPHLGVILGTPGKSGR